MLTNLMINKLGYKPTPIFLEKYEELRKLNFGLAFEPKGLRRHMPDPMVMSMLGSPLAGNMQGSNGLASAATITIVNGITRITGNTQVTLVKMLTGFRGVFGVYSTDASPFTTATGGTYAASDGTYESIPFALASTVVRYKLLLLLNDGSFLYPSY